MEVKLDITMDEIDKMAVIALKDAIELNKNLDEGEDIIESLIKVHNYFCLPNEKIKLCGSQKTEENASDLKFYEHPGYIGYAGDKDMANDYRQQAWERQYFERGFDDTVTWSLDEMLIKWLTPRLKKFLEFSEDFTGDNDEFHKDVKEMLKGFEFYLSDEFDEIDKKHVKKVDKSFKLLAKNYKKLWW